jgi:putative hemolysin
VPVRELNRELDVELPESEQWTSVAGLVIALCGAIPPPGAQVRSPDGTVIEVREATTHRVVSITVRPPPLAT